MCCFYSNEHGSVLFSGISPDEIVKISTKYNEEREQNSSKHKGNRVRNPFLIILSIVH